MVNQSTIVNRRPVRERAFFQSVYILQMTILLRMDDKMNRQLTCPVSQTDTSMLLAQELVHFGFINEVNIPSCFASSASIRVIKKKK